MIGYLPIRKNHGEKIDISVYNEFIYDKLAKKMKVRNFSWGIGFLGFYGAFVFYLQWALFSAIVGSTESGKQGLP
ncbi:hypothetical protein ACTUHY_04595 [Acidaminococcus sp. LBK-2]|uniref:hypothetical protein n=1 Tax=Acidaminococcus sp. LBK-2 TaxID=3456956 RepID=UPI003FA47D7D